jgi:hypothetical protein
LHALPNSVVVVGLQVQTTPHSLMLRAAQIDAVTVKNLVDVHCSVTITKRPSPVSASSAPSPSCPVCLNPVVQTATPAFLPRCGHSYCADCFTAQCTAATDTGFPLRCLDCDTVFSLDNLKDGLSARQFEDILAGSYAAYVRTHPTVFQNCPTPDCQHIFRASDDGLVVVCAGCSAAVCTTCRTLNHKDLTCEEFKDLKKEGVLAFERWKRKNGVKNCPTCRVPIEKRYGCNHMECTSCRSHICWFCMKTFDTGSNVYAHMRAKHGSISG